MYYEALKARGDAVWLFNVDVSESDEFVKCGLATFLFRLTHKIQLYDLKGNPIVSVIPPEEVQQARTYVILSDPLDQVLIKKG